MTYVPLRGKRVLVTGGAGFIGSELVRQLVDGGSIVTVVDNLVNGKRENLAGLDKGLLRLVVADVRDADTMKDVMRDADIVLHLACLGVRHSIHSPMESHAVNATATLALLQAAEAATVDRFVYVSTSEVYGTAVQVPMGEDHPTYPMTVYGGAKLAGEAYARAYHRTYGFPTVVVRPFNAYGPRSHHEGDSGEVIPKFLLRAMAGEPLVIFGDGMQTRDFTYVSDTARGILKCAEADGAIGETFNLGSDKEITIDRLASLVERVTGQDARREYLPQRPGDTLRLFSDSTKARERLGFQPAVGLEEGLRRLHAWYLQDCDTPQALLRAERVRNWEMQA